MAKTPFNETASPKMGNYHIDLAYPAGIEIMDEMLAAGHFKEKLTHWVEQQTGIRPDVQIFDNNGKQAISVYASSAFMKKIDAQFGNEIAKIERIAAWSELPPEQREPWHRKPPRGMKP